MAKPKAGRKALFRAALAIAGMTQESWAVQEGVTPQWVSAVLNQHETSDKLNGKIDVFIREHLHRHTAMAS